LSELFWLWVSCLNPRYILLAITAGARVSPFGVGISPFTIISWVIGAPGSVGFPVEEFYKLLDLSFLFWMLGFAVLNPAYPY
jgi:hypothetical protein